MTPKTKNTAYFHHSFKKCLPWQLQNTLRLCILLDATKTNKANVVDDIEPWTAPNFILFHELRSFSTECPLESKAMCNPFLGTLNHNAIRLAIQKGQDTQKELIIETVTELALIGPLQKPSLPQKSWNYCLSSISNQASDGVTLIYQMEWKLPSWENVGERKVKYTPRRILRSPE